ncbi:hypothetical protein SH601_16745 [Gracilibacillus sp. S3-1-1]|uniref:Uncharacterized protein n=1 Tax=Gracilibacillus pellucidus TaxID=3095368 RepID=A0ACC6M9P1_9BACI|nr:hypothetical protein [Gracilibacillus sp. S3-1-1]MDX8047611.1 hypothetical protein [Gracilibacillus sp. S3-1-1]
MQLKYVKYLTAFLVSLALLAGCAQNEEEEQPAEPEQPLEEQQPQEEAPTDENPDGGTGEDIGDNVEEDMDDAEREMEDIIENDDENKEN